MKKDIHVYILFLLALFSYPIIGLSAEETNLTTNSDVRISETNPTSETMEDTSEAVTTLIEEDQNKEKVRNSQSQHRAHEQNLNYVAQQSYLSLNKKDQSLFDREGEKIIGSTNSYLNQTVKTKAYAIHPNGKTLFQIFDNNDNEIGYIFDEAATQNNGAQGSYYSFGEYATITGNSSQTWQNFEWVEKNSNSELTNKTFFAKGIYHHFNGESYLSIFDNKGKWFGYINQNQTSLSNSAQGSYVNYIKYVTYSNKNYNTWTNFDWTYRTNGNQLVNRTFHAKGIYYHYNGEAYLSLYDQNGKWFGYVNQKATKQVDGPQGNYQSYGKYVTFRNKNYDTWSSFNWNKRSSGQNLVDKTYLARGIYRHANGNDYLSLYDNQNNWKGYVNSRAVSIAGGKQGSYQAHNKYVSIKSANYSTWQNFDWKKKATTNNIYQKTLLAKGIYHHFNGETYLSLFDNNDKWYGYLNQNATQETVRTGKAITINKHVTVKSRNYDLWNNLNFSSSRGKTTNMLNKPYLAKVKYEHFNGSTYYSLYDKNDKWQGYINNTGVHEAAGNNSTYVMLNAPYYNQMEKINGRTAYMGCEAASLLQALQLKGYAKNYTLHPFIDVMPRSKNDNPNNGFSGDPYGNKYGVYHSIYPKPLTDWANKYAKGNAHNISGSSLTQLNKELVQGNPIVLYATINFEKADPLRQYHWGKAFDNAHVVTLDGYNSQKNQYHVSDPNEKGGYWVNGKQLQTSYFANEKRAVVIR